MSDQRPRPLPDGSLAPNLLQTELKSLYRDLAQARKRVAELEADVTAAGRAEREAWCKRLVKVASFQQALASAGALAREADPDPAAAGTIARLAEQFETLLRGLGIRVEIPAGVYDDAVAERTDVKDAVAGDVDVPQVRAVYEPVVEIDGHIWQRGLISKLIPRAESGPSADGRQPIE